MVWCPLRPHFGKQRYKYIVRSIFGDFMKDQNYIKMSDNFENSVAFSAACDLVFKGRVQPSGYTEPLLHKKRLEKKSSH